MRVRNVECGMRSSQWKFVWANSPLRTPHSALAVEDRRLFSAPGRSEAKMPERGCRSDAAARGAGEEALLHQERLVHLLERPRVLAHGGADRLQSHGAASDRPLIVLRVRAAMASQPDFSPSHRFHCPSATGP